MVQHIAYIHLSKFYDWYKNTTRLQKEVYRLLTIPNPNTPHKCIWTKLP